MKREAMSSTKIKRLCRHLNLRLYQAAGILEALWHLTAREAPQGDIGKLSNEDIAMALDYEKNEDDLIEALVASRWLDRSDEHRLVVHDWHEHADESVKKRLERSKKPFLSRCVSTSSRHIGAAAKHVFLPEPEPEPEPVPVPVPEPAPEPMRANGNGNHRPPDPNFEVWAEAAYARHPKKADKFLGLKALHETFAGHPQLQRTFDKHHEFMCKTPEWREKHGRFAPRLHEWITNDGWRSPPEECGTNEPDGIRYLRELAKGVSGEA